MHPRVVICKWVKEEQHNCDGWPDVKFIKKPNARQIYTLSDSYQLFTEVEVNSSGYSPSHEAAR